MLSIFASTVLPVSPYCLQHMTWPPSPVCGFPFLQPHCPGTWFHLVAARSASRSDCALPSVFQAALVLVAVPCGGDHSIDADADQYTEPWIHSVCQCSNTIAILPPSPMSPAGFRYSVLKQVLLPMPGS